MMKKIVFTAGVVLMLCFNSLSQVDLLNGLVAWYKFDSNANDFSGKGNHGINHGATPANDRFGTPNSAYHFNGSAYIEVPDSPSINPYRQLSVSLWVKIDALVNRYTPILHKGGQYLPGYMNREYIMYIENNGYMFTESTGDSHQVYNFAKVPVDSSWFFYTAVIDRLNHKFIVYINGIKKSEIPDMDSFFHINSNSLNIGTWDETNAAYARYFQGSLDDIRIYNRILNDTDILVLYNGTSSGIQDQDKQQISLYPNPVSTSLHINGLKGITKAVIYDIFGKTIFEGIPYDNKIDVSGFSKGTYLIRLIDSRGEMTAKFIRN